MIVKQEEIDGIKDILSEFEDDEVLALATTVTERLLKNKLVSRDIAIEAILKYSPNVISFLKRKAVTRENLFNYLHIKGADVKLPITKDKLIERILVLWDSTSTEIVPIEVTRNEYSKQSTPTSNIELPNEELVEMGKKFSEWFYSMMNHNTEIDREHFYSDAILTLNLINGQKMYSCETMHGVNEIVAALFKTKSEHNLYFNPNLTADGTKAEMDPHGLVVIISCGTIHVNETVSGVFEQMFSLARDPFADNNWKIKNTKLILRSRNVNVMPRLCDTEFNEGLSMQEIT